MADRMFSCKKPPNNRMQPCGLARNCVTETKLERPSVRASDTCAKQCRGEVPQNPSYEKTAASNESKKRIFYRQNTHKAAMGIRKRRSRGILSAVLGPRRARVCAGQAPKWREFAEGWRPKRNGPPYPKRTRPHLWPPMLAGAVPAKD